jgi:hypothetical protein
MKIRYRKKFFLALLYPFLPLIALTFRTVPVTATVITIAHYTTVSTGIFMSAQSGGATAFYGT